MSRLVVLHNSLHDLPVLRDLGLDLVRENIPFTDTMVMAYLLGLEPQGLKPLAYRHAGMTQDSYDDIISEASERIARTWLNELVVGLPFLADGHPNAADITKAQKLIEQMLKATGKRSLRGRWGDCRAREILQDELFLLDDMPEATLDDVDPATAIRYSARDADATRRIYPALSAQIDAMGLRDVLDADIAALPMIDRMQSVGLGVDVQHYHDLSTLFAMEMADLQDQINTAAGMVVNAASGDQVAEWLFGRLKLPSKKKTDGGRPSTNDKVLEALRKRADIGEAGRRAIELVQEYREVQKLKRTFSDKIPKFVNPRTGRVHPMLRVTRVATGRLSAGGGLNWLAMPKRSERGLLIREGVVAAPGRVLGSWDLSQIELCVLAIDSGDERMLAQFASGHDFHLMGAAERYGKKPEDVTYDERYTQKAINFGTLMGITEHGLLDQFHKNGNMNVTLEDCRRQLADWHKDYPQASSYIYGKHAEARRYGYVRDMWGRLRYLPGVHSPDKYIREEALRQAQATPIQSGAQGIEKRLMAAIWRRLPQLWEMGVWVEPLLQVHDDLLFEVQADAVSLLDDLIHDALSELQCFPIPITAKGETGARWSDL